MINPLATELNELFASASPHVLEMLSTMGKALFFPKGILTQTAEANTSATCYNATVGMARQLDQVMHLPSVMNQINGLEPNQALSYAPSPGDPQLRLEWQKSLLEKNPSLAGKIISKPLVTCGITHGLSLIADMFVEKNDAVLLPDMSWGNYNMIFGVRREACMKRYQLFSSEGKFDNHSFGLHCQRLASTGKIVVILNFPNNPTGYTVSESEAEKIIQTLTSVAESGCNTIVVCDDAYFGLFYGDNVMRESIFARLVSCHPRLLAVKLDGATKEDFVWGLRVGFLTFAIAEGSQIVYEALEKKTGGCIRSTVSNVSRLSQSILLTAMRSSAYCGEKRQNSAILQQRFEKTKTVLAQRKFATAWSPYPFNSGYFLCLQLIGLDAETYRCRLLETQGIGVIATSNTDIRVTFASLEIGDIEDCFQRMLICAQEMQG